MTYSVKEIFEEILRESVTPFFKKYGYKKQNYNFRKTENGLTCLINFQSSGYNSVDYATYYVNCGIFCAEFESIVGEEFIANPKEVDCLFRERMERITGSGKQQIEIIESSDAGKIRITNELLSELEKVISFFGKTKTMDDLVDLCIERHTFFYEKIFHYLCIKKDMIRLENFFQKFGDNFKDDDRFIFFESRLNDILVSHGIGEMKFKA